MGDTNGFHQEDNGNGSSSNGHGSPSNRSGSPSNGNGSISNGTDSFSPNSRSPPSSFNRTEVTTATSNGTISDPDLNKLFKRLEIEPGEAKLPPRMTAGIQAAGDKSFTAFTNVYPLKTEDAKIYQYHVEVTRVGIKDGQPAFFPYHLDRQMKTNDFILHRNRNELRQLMNMFIAKNPNFFGKQGPDLFCYDYDHTLFSLVKLPELPKPLELLEADVNPIVNMRTSGMQLSITSPQEDHVFSLKEFADFSSNLFDLDTNVVRFLELATSRYAGEHPDEHCTYESKKTYFMNPANYGFGPHSCPDLDAGKYLNVGASKAVVRVENAENGPSIVVDSKKSAFIKAMPLIDYSMNLLKVNHDANVLGNLNLTDTLERNIRSLCVQTNYLENPTTFVIHGITNKDANRCTFSYNGGEISVAEYYRQKYNYHLGCPHWPLVIQKKKGQESFFPFEVLNICDFQRVSNRKLTSEDLKIIVKQCAVAPSVKAGEVRKCLRSYFINDEKFCQNTDIKVSENPVELQGRILAAPMISYANGNLKPEGNGKWRLPRPAKYVKTGIMKVWGAILIRYPGERFNIGDFTNFVQRYVQECRNRGVNVADPVGVWECGNAEQEIEAQFKDGQSNGCEFILFGHPDREIILHPLIKAYERKYQVISQCVRTKTMANVLQRSPLSLENIVAKTNVKLGGLNYDLILDNYNIDPKVLFIGLGINHPAGGFGSAATAAAKNRSYTILGFSANDGRHPKEFIGNFFVQPPFHADTINILDEILTEVLERFVKYRGYKPEHVVIYRTGCSEGQFRGIMSMELPVIKKLLDCFAPGATLTVIVPSKNHSVRFFRNDMDPRARSDDQNLRPGSCFDTTIVHPSFSEFYLNSHLAIQGTAKTTKYTVVYTNYPDKTLNTFERWTNALAYNFQIVTSPTSLPAPVYIANRYAERGRQLFNASLSSDRGPEHFFDDIAEARAEEHSEFYHESLKYNFSKKGYLRDKRINA